MPLQSTYKQIDNKKGIFYAWFSSMHTRIDLILCDHCREDMEQLAQAVYDEISFLDGIGDRFDQDSDISFINRNAAQFPVWVKPDMFKMIDLCIGFNTSTYGLFDITVQSRNEYKEGIRNIVLNEDGSSVFFRNRDLQIDLCGFIKGYALDKATQILRSGGCANALINIGNSSVMALGNHPFGEGWKVKTNYVESRGLKNVEVILHDECMTTSGNLHQERRHIVNPFTQEFIEGVKVVSTITKTGAEGEAFSTALIAASEEQRQQICEDTVGRIKVI